MVSQLNHSIGIVSPATYLWGVATLSIPASAVVEVTERLIPNGPKKSSRMTSCQSRPDTARSTSPAAMNIRFEYP